MNYPGSSARSILFFTILIFSMFSLAAAAQTENILHRFFGTDGSAPGARLTVDAAGNFYGTTEFGGHGGFGTVFKLTPPATAGAQWTETVLYGFRGGTDGGQPSGGVVFDHAGNLYGATVSGGNRNTHVGVIYELSPPATSGGSWTETVLYSFGTAAGDGFFPFGELVFDSAGNLYGVTEVGGSGSCSQTNGCGTVFQLQPPTTPGGVWTENIIHNFMAPGANDGFDPGSGLVLAPNGVLYGTTSVGGPNGDGAVFKLTPPTTSGGNWSEKVIYAFSGSDGNTPGALTLAKNGTIYGETYRGGTFDGGTIFQLTPPSSGSGWTESVLLSFLGMGGGGPATPSGVILDAQGNLYGVTRFEGDLDCRPGNGCGTVYRLSPPAVAGGAWTQTILHEFTSTPDGDAPLGSLLLSRGALFGTTLAGGRSTNAGTVFRVVP